MKGNSSPAQGISPLSAAPCSPAQWCYFTLAQDEREALVGAQGHWWRVLCTLDIHLTCNRGAVWSSEQNKGPPNGTWADALRACVSVDSFSTFRVVHPLMGVCLQDSSLLCTTWHFKYTHTSHILVSLKGKGKYLRDASAYMQKMHIHTLLHRTKCLLPNKIISCYRQS